MKPFRVSVLAADGVTWAATAIVVVGPDGPIKVRLFWITADGVPSPPTTDAWLDLTGAALMIHNKSD